MGCTGNCSSCSSNCNEKQDLHVPCNEYSKIKKVIGVVSGKGGVGKSLVTSMLTTAMQVKGNACAILDADITGPSIPRAFGAKGPAMQNEMGLLPAVSKTGIKLMSINLLLEKEDQPVIWRGPVISGVIQQFWQEVFWGDVDYMFVDMPPGTGDVPLTVFQSLPVDGIVVVTSPQDLVSMVVEKAIKMAAMLDIPVLGLVENMSYFKCPTCGEEHHIYGESSIEALASKYQVANIAKLPIDPNVAAAVDGGAVETCKGEWLEELAKAIMA